MKNMKNMKNMKKSVAMVFALLLAIGGHAAIAAPAPDRMDTSNAAQAAYDQAMSILPTDAAAARAGFKDAAAKFQQAVDLGTPSGALYFNLGNALLQSGETGRAIGAYLEADHLLPGDERVEANLAHARSLVSAAPPPPDSSSWLDSTASLWGAISPAVRTLLAVAGWTALWIVVAAGVVTGWPRKLAWRATIVTLGVASALAASTIGFDALRGWINPHGVLIVDNVVVRKGNGEGFAPAFTTALPSGAEFALVEQRPGWYCIRVGDGQTGWVRASDAIIAGSGS